MMNSLDLTGVSLEKAIDRIMNSPEIEIYKPEIIRQLREEKLKRLLDEEL